MKWLRSKRCNYRGFDATLVPSEQHLNNTGFGPGELINNDPNKNDWKIGFEMFCAIGKHFGGAKTKPIYLFVSREQQ